MDVAKPDPQDLFEANEPSPKTPKGLQGMSLAELEDDPDINFHLQPDTGNAKSRFVLWSRKSMNTFEKKVYKTIGGDSNPWIFIPQVEILGFVVDFYSPRHKTVIEADGPDHDSTVLADRRRDRVLLDKKGIKTLRLSPADLNHHSRQEIFARVEHFVDDAEINAGSFDDGGL